MTETKPLVFNRILLTIDPDDAEANEKALRYACTQAKEFGADLGICSVLESRDLNVFDSMTKDKVEDLRNKLRNTIEDYVQRAEDFGVQSVTAMASEEDGDIDDEVLENIIPDFKPDLLVCGADKDGEHGHFSISITLARKAKISAVVIR